MSTSQKIEDRINNENTYNITQKVNQCCHIVSKGNNYWAWLVDENHNTLLRSNEFCKTFPKDYFISHDLQGSTRLCQGQRFAGTFNVLELETTTRTKKGRELFKNIIPELPLEPQIRKLYGKNASMESFGIISRNSEGTNFKLWPEDKTATTIIGGLDALPDEIETPEIEASSEKLVAQNTSFFERNCISQKKPTVLSEEQKEIQVAHMFDGKALVIDGGPGTGKTATMIQRLKMLIADDFYGDKDFTQDDFKHSTNLQRLREIWETFLRDYPKDRAWTFFSPTVQLQNFLMNSLSSNGLPDPVNSTKVWCEKGKTNNGYAFELARDTYHFLNIHGKAKTLKGTNYFKESPQATYDSFVHLLLQELEKEYKEKFSALSAKIEQIHNERIPNAASLLPKTGTLSEYLSFMVRFNEDNAEETYQKLWQNAIIDKTNAFVKSAKDEIKNKIFELSSPSKQYFNWSLLLLFIEKNAAPIFKKALKKVKADNEDPDENVLLAYEAFKDVMKVTYAKKGFKDQTFSTSLIEDSFNQSFDDCKKSWERELTRCQNDLDELDADYNEKKSKRDALNEAKNKQQPYSVSEKEKADQEYEAINKEKNKYEKLVKKYSEWIKFDYNNSTAWESSLIDLTEAFMQGLVENYIQNDSSAIEKVLKDFSIYQSLEENFKCYKELHQVYTEVIGEKDVIDLFIHKVKKLYENDFRQSQGFSTLKDDGSAHLQQQEYSFLIYLGNTLAKKLYKSNTPAFRLIAKEEEKMINTYRNSEEPQNVLGYTMVSGYQTCWKIVIGIDEATDFTPIELAAIASLGHPQYNCITLSGDQMQAFNEKGITKWEQLGDGIFENGYEVMQLNVSFRQSPTLLDMANKIYQRNMGIEAPYKSKVDGSAFAEPKPLLFKSDDDDEKIQWIAEKILAIHSSKANLPATAIFYPSDKKGEIEDFVDSINEHLSEIGGVESCYSANKDARIVVYPISLVKGLEFEAAFFFNLDQLKNAKLMEQYLYVGLSRATFYMAATTTTDWDAPLAKDFTTDEATSNWPQ